MRDDDPPELRGYDPADDRPLRHPMMMRVMRIVIVVGIAGLIAPAVITTIGFQSRNAGILCDRLLSGSPDAEPVARFELLGPSGPAWYCFARTSQHRETLVASLGLIPG